MNRPSNIARSGQYGRSFIEEARRDQIVGHAIDTIAAIGWPQASFERIARRAGISRSLISYHFAGRDELRDQILLAVYRAGEEFVTPRVAAQGAPGEALATFITSSLEFIDSHRSQVAAAISIMVNARSDAPAARPEAGAAVPRAAGLERILEWGQQAGEFRSISTQSMTVCILQAIDGAYTVLDADADLRAYGDELVTTFALATRIPPSPATGRSDP